MGYVFATKLQVIVPLLRKIMLRIISPNKPSISIYWWFHPSAKQLDVAKQNWVIEMCPSASGQANKMTLTRELYNILMQLNSLAISATGKCTVYILSFH